MLDSQVVRASEPSYFDRLRAVADLRYDDSAEETAYNTVMEQISECERLVSAGRRERVGGGVPFRSHAHAG